MLPKDTEADYFIWFNPHNLLYEAGDARKFDIVKQIESIDSPVSLILKFNKYSHAIADKIVLELNSTKEKMGL